MQHSTHLSIRLVLTFKVSTQNTSPPQIFQYACIDQRSIFIYVFRYIQWNAQVISFNINLCNPNCSAFQRGKPCFNGLLFPVVEIHINRIIQYQIFLNQHNIFETHTDCYMHLWFVPFCHWVVFCCKLHHVFICSPIDGYLGCFQLAIVGKPTKNICVWAIAWACAFISLG